MLALLSLIKVISFVFVLVWAYMHSLQRDDFPRRQFNFLLLAIGLLSLRSMYELWEVIRLGAHTQEYSSLFFIELAAAILLAYGSSAWFPRVSSARRKRELLSELSALQSQITSEERGRLEFMKSFSFDIRSVLQSLYKLDELGPKEVTHESAHKQLSQAVAHVSSVVNEYLVAQELDCTLTTFNKTQFNLRDELEALAGAQAISAIQESNSGMQKPAIPLHIKVDESVPSTFFTDAEKLKHIVGTLTAFMRGRAEGIKEAVLEVKVSKLDEEEARLQFILSAKKGTFTERASELLERCLNLSTADYSAEMRMHGISISNASRMLALFGGSLEYVNSPASFSFSIRLPLYKGMAWSQIAESRERDTKNRFPGLRVLVVDDNVIHGEIAKRVLEDFGCQVHYASGGREALGVICSKEIDMIFMDCDMPEIDGFETTQFIRKTEQKRGIRRPIIALTAHAMKEARRRCTEAGMDSFVAKPADSVEIAAAIEEQIEKYNLCFDGSSNNDTSAQEQKNEDPDFDYYFMMN